MRCGPVNHPSRASSATGTSEPSLVSPTALLELAEHLGKPLLTTDRELSSAASIAELPWGI